MEIQQKEKESLAAYIHHFKTEAKRCNFTNNTATIRIFVKGLKNTHSFATQIYEKGQQTLADAISEVEKLQAAQLTATLIPSSTVNVMSHKEDHCFQCQESGHISHHYPNVQCFRCDEYGHIVMDCPHRIPPSGTPAHCHRPQSCSNHHTRSNSCHHHEDRYRSSRSRSQSHPCRYHSKSHHNSYRGHSRSTTGITDTIAGVVHGTHTQTLIHIILAMTLHIVDHLPTEALQLTPGITADHTLAQPTNPPGKSLINLYHIPEDHKGKHIPKGIQELQ